MTTIKNVLVPAAAPPPPPPPILSPVVREPPEAPECELSDDQILRIMSYLNPQDLVASARGVSRRWRRLSEHPSLWTNRRVVVEGPRDFPWFTQMLRAAPFVEQLQMEFGPMPSESDAVSAALLDALANTVCCIGRLEVACTAAEWDKPLIEELVLHQRELGFHLGYVSITVTGTRRTFGLDDLLYSLQIDEYRLRLIDVERRVTECHDRFVRNGKEKVFVTIMKMR